MIPGSILSPGLQRMRNGALVRGYLTDMLNVHNFVLIWSQVVPYLGRVSSCNAVFASSTSYTAFCSCIHNKYNFFCCISLSLMIVKPNLHELHTNM